jgi:hypothetical protein
VTLIHAGEYGVNLDGIDFGFAKYSHIQVTRIAGSNLVKSSLPPHYEKEVSTDFSFSR